MLTLRNNKIQLNWWNLVEGQCEVFFEASGALNTYTPNQEVEHLLGVMQNALTAIEHADCPDHALTARHHLITALREMLAGFKALLSGEYDHADTFMANAEDGLKCFDSAMQQLT